MKVIEIASSEDFGLIYQGFIIGGNSVSSKTMQVIRREAKILDKLEDISQPVGDNRYPTGDRVRELVATENDAPVKLKLTDEELELLKQYFESVPWVTKLSREVVRLADLLDSAKEG